ncbi:MAG: kinase/pyrophosphorylase [Coriobacteriia bacterium]|nr:kinase/pyrophosphorylase [Coriobacteriia bacterium]
MAGPITIHILSDSVGETAEAVARAALSQFPRGAFVLERLPKVSSASQLRDMVEAHCGTYCIFFYTFVQQSLREEMRALVTEKGVRGVDVVGPAVDLLGSIHGSAPRGEAGAIRQPDEEYFDRIEAMEYTIRHDDGRNPADLTHADIVLIGVSRTGKTPLSIYLALKGYLVANIPLTPDTDPPRELFDCEPRRVFGLLSDPDVLSEIRAKRMAELGTYVSHYAERNDIEDELDEARALMRKIGCFSIRTDNRAIEETAQEVIRHLHGALEIQD